MKNNFLLKNSLAQRLYHEHIAQLPIIDYHNHLPINDIYENKMYEDIAELWLISDPYKHRAMRICGIEEKYITGTASNYEKFCAWCNIVPNMIGNPLQQWSWMEINGVLGIKDRICRENAPIIWKKANALLKNTEFSAQGLFSKFNVEYAAPCCHITENISCFDLLPGLVPSLRGDDIMSLSAEFVKKLEKVSKIKIYNSNSLKKALCIQLDKFHKMGCRFSDHAIDAGFEYIADDGNSEERLNWKLSGKKLSEADSCALNCDVLRMLSEEYSKRGWTLQLHIGALRSTSSRLCKLTGTAGGYAGIGRYDVAGIVKFFDDLEKKGRLPRTILFTLNPSYNEELSVLSGSFCEDKLEGKIQQGAAWWWCDHADGIRDVLDSMSAYSVISVFLGMTTDSRNILSFVRHDYFRRIFCSWLCEKVKNNEFETHYPSIVNIAKKVCYENIKNLIRRI